MTATNPEEGCRLVLISPDQGSWQDRAAKMEEASEGGDIASMILWPGGLEEDDFQRMCAKAVPAGQARGIAMIIAGEARMAMRVGADGIHAQSVSELAQLSERNRDLILGTGGARTRHEALEMGEYRPDYILFGRFGYDTTPEPHPRNLSLGEWWSEMIEIPCIVCAGAQLDSIRTAALTGAEFVAASAAIFGYPDGLGKAVAAANLLLADLPARTGRP